MIILLQSHKQKQLKASMYHENQSVLAHGSQYIILVHMWNLLHRNSDMAHSKSLNYIDAFTLNLHFVNIWLHRPVDPNKCYCLQTDIWLFRLLRHWVSNCHTMDPCTMERMERWSPWGMSLLTAVYFVTVKVSLINK